MRYRFDLIAIAGLILLGVGASMAYLPAGPIIVGLVLLAIGTFGDLAEARAEAQAQRDKRGS